MPSEGSQGRTASRSSAIQSNIAEETLSIHRDGRKIMDTRLARISQLSCENPSMVFTSIGHMIDKELLRQCHVKMNGDKALEWME